MKFVLIGDSGEEDPEIYSEVVRRWPERVRVIYIRSDNRDPSRLAAIDGLIAEVMGKNTGVCAGLGGSQHLHAKGFFSNGIQGGIVPVSAGLAFGHKLRGKSATVAVCIGDGTLGDEAEPAGLRE